MRNRRLLILLLLFLVPVAILLASGTSFTPFTSAEGKFTVLMPGEPEKKTKTARGVKYIAYGASVSEGVFAVGYSDLTNPSGVNLSDNIKAIAKAHGGTLVSDGAYIFGDKPGRQFEARTTKPKGYVSGRVMIVGSRYYAITVLGEKARLSNSTVQTYLQSFKTK
jgi:hypothetical protein